MSDLILGYYMGPKILNDYRLNGRPLNDKI